MASKRVVEIASIMPSKAHNIYLRGEDNVMPTDLLENVPSVDEVIREVNRLRTTVTQAVEDGFKSAVKAVEQGRHATEDMIDDGKRMMRRKPVESAGVIFAAGMLTGAFVTWLACRLD